MDKHEIVAVEAAVKDEQVVLKLLDGSTHSFPIHFYSRLAAATSKQLADVRLRVGGRALRWEEIDEDIWVTDAVLGRYPAGAAVAV